jgi:hypothetical protein
MLLMQDGMNEDKRFESSETEFGSTEFFLPLAVIRPRGRAHAGVFRRAAP